MERSISVNGKHHRVRVLDLRGRRHCRVEVDGKEYKVELPNDSLNSSRVSLKVDGKYYTVESNKIEGNRQFLVKVNGRPFTVRCENAAKTLALRPFGLTLPMPAKEKVRTVKPVLESGVMAAPMPGIVVSLKVNVGDKVREGDVLCVLEAMKMENEVTATQAGIVSEIKVSVGSSVKRGETLIVLKPS